MEVPSRWPTMPQRARRGVAGERAGGEAGGYLAGGALEVARERAPVVAGGGGCPAVHVPAGVARLDGGARGDEAGQAAGVGGPGGVGLGRHVPGGEAGDDVGGRVDGHLPDHADQTARVRGGVAVGGGEHVALDVGPGVAGCDVGAPDQAHQTADVEGVGCGDLRDGLHAAGGVAARDVRLAPAGEDADVDVGDDVRRDVEGHVRVLDRYVRHVDVGRWAGGGRRGRRSFRWSSS